MNASELIAHVVEHVRGMWRYRWWAAMAAWGMCLLGWTYVYSIPDVYRASAQVFVDTSSLLRPLMQGLTATSDTMNEVQLVSRAVLTRPNLEKVAYETDLALRAPTPEALELLVTDLQTRILVAGGRENIFTIQYEDFDRDKARDVVAAVLDTFVESALGNEGSDSDVTERALANEIEVHERRLKDAEDQLAKFKQDNLGYMPGETGDYYNRLQAALGSVAGTQEKLRLVEQRRDELRRQIEGEEPVFGIMPPTVGAAQCARGAQLSALRAQLAELRVNFTDKHPRVVTLEETIAQLEQDCQSEAPTAPIATAASMPDGGQLELNPVYQNLRLQLSTSEVERAELAARLDAEQSTVQRLRRDVDKITQVETDLKQMNRDYAVVQTRHQELLKRWEDLQAKQRLDPVTDNVQFRKIEPPFALADPVAPNRPILLALVLLVGLGGAGALAFALNQVNPVFFTRVGVGKAVPFPVLGTISMILTPEVLTKRRRATYGWIGVMLLLFVAMIASVVLARQGTALVQALLFGAST